MNLCLFFVFAIAANAAEPTVKVTYINYDAPDTAVGEIAPDTQFGLGYNKISGGSVELANKGWGVNKIGYVQVDLSQIEGYLVKATLNAEVTGADNRRTTGWGVGYNNSTWSADMTWNTADRTITQIGEEFWTKTKLTTEFEAASFNITEAFKNDEDKIATILIYQLAAGNCNIKNINVTVETTDKPMVDYNVIHVCTINGENQKIKENTTGSAPAGTTVSFSADDLPAVYSEDGTMKFIYVSDNAALRPLKEEGVNNIQVKYRIAETWNYSIDAVDAEGNVLKENIITNSNFEAENFRVFYPKYVNIDGTLYEAGKLSADKKSYFFEFALDANNKKGTIAYNKAVENVVFYSEGEDLPGASVQTASNADVRASNGKFGYSTENDFDLISLPQGRYVFGVGAFDGRKGNGAMELILTSNGFPIYTATSAAGGNLYVNTSGEISLTESSNVIVLKKDNMESTDGVDYIYIQRLGGITTGPVIDINDSTYNFQNGDITSETVVEAEGLTMTISPSDAAAANSFKMHRGAQQLRMNGGTLTFKAENGKAIKELKVEYYGSYWNATVDTTEVVDGIWTGEANEVVMKFNSLSRINKITALVEQTATPVPYGALPISKIVDDKGLASGKKAEILSDTTLICDNFTVTISANPSTEANAKANCWENYYGMAKRLSLQAGSTITFKANAGMFINKITLPKNRNVSPTTVSFDCGEYTYAASKGVWTGNAETVVMTVVRNVNLEIVEVGEKPAAYVETIAALKDVEDGENVTLSLTNAQVMYVNPKVTYDEIYVNDGTGSILLNKTGLTTTAGKAITGQVYGTYTKNDNYFFSIVGNDKTAEKSDITEGEGSYAAPVITDLKAYNKDKATYANQLVTISNVFGSWDDDNGEGTLSMGETNVYLKDKFISLDGVIPAYIEKISGIMVYASYDQLFCPISVDSIKAGVIVPEEVANVAALAEKADGAFVKLALNDAVVAYAGVDAMGTVAFVEDATGAIKFQGIENEAIATNKKLNGHVVGQLYKVVDEENGATILTVKGISITAEQSAITSTDTEFVAEVVEDITMIQADPTKYVNKLITLANVDIMENWGSAMLYQGDLYGYTVNVEDAFAALGYDYVYPKKAEKFSGIFTISDGWAVIYPVSADSIVAATIKWKEVANIAELKALTTAEDVKLNAENLMVTVSETVEGWMGATTTAIIEDATGAVQIEASAEAAPLHEALLSAGGVYNGTLCLTVDASMVQWGGGLIITPNDSTVASPLVAVEGRVAEPTVMTMADAQKEENAYRWIKFENVETIEGEYVGYFQFSDGTATLDQQDPWMNLQYDSVWVEEWEYWETTPVVVEKYEYLTAILISSWDGYMIYPVSYKVASDEPGTGITDINANVNILNGNVYSLNGLKVREAGQSLKGLKGLYIINGKKVVIK